MATLPAILPSARQSDPSNRSLAISMSSRVAISGHDVWILSPGLSTAGLIFFGDGRRGRNQAGGRRGANAQSSAWERAKRLELIPVGLTHNLSVVMPGHSPRRASGRLRPSSPGYAVNALLCRAPTSSRNKARRRWPGHPRDEVPGGGHEALGGSTRSKHALRESRKRSESECLKRGSGLPVADHEKARQVTGLFHEFGAADLLPLGQRARTSIGHRRALEVPTVLSGDAVIACARN